MRIKVTLGHIAESTRRKNRWLVRYLRELHCPVALALKDATGKRWHVHESSASLTETGEGIPLPKEVRDWIDAADANGEANKVGPLAFDFPFEKRTRTG